MTPKLSSIYRRFICTSVLVAFLTTNVIPPSYAQNLLPRFPVQAKLPVFTPVMISGISLHRDDPFKLDFIVDIGDDHKEGEAFQKEANKLIHYFMAAMTVPDDDMWVNLSPTEKNRIIMPSLSATELGTDMLVMDYLLKQAAAAMFDPQTEAGKKIWEELDRRGASPWAPDSGHERIVDGRTQGSVPTEILSKIWIIPDEASVYVHDNTVLVTKSHLKVMFAEDLQRSPDDQNRRGASPCAPDSEEECIVDERTQGSVPTNTIRETILPVIEEKINTSKEFANLRQIYNAMILATWYKKNLKESLLSQMYANQNKINGIDLAEKGSKDKIYNEYLAAFKKGVSQVIKETYDPQTQEIVAKRYFTGGLEGVKNITNRSISMPWVMSQAKRNFDMVSTRIDVNRSTAINTWSEDYDAVIPENSGTSAISFELTGRGQLYVQKRNAERFHGWSTSVWDLQDLTNGQRERNVFGLNYPLDLIVDEEGKFFALEQNVAKDTDVVTFEKEIQRFNLNSSARRLAIYKNILFTLNERDGHSSIEAYEINAGKIKRRLKAFGVEIDTILQDIQVTDGGVLIGWNKNGVYVISSVVSPTSLGVGNNFNTALVHFQQESTTKTQTLKLVSGITISYPLAIVSGKTGVLARFKKSKNLIAAESVKIIDLTKVGRNEDVLVDTSQEHLFVGLRGRGEVFQFSFDDFSDGQIIIDENKIQPIVRLKSDTFVDDVYGTQLLRMVVDKRHSGSLRLLLLTNNAIRIFNAHVKSSAIAPQVLAVTTVVPENILDVAKQLYAQAYNMWAYHFSFGEKNGGFEHTPGWDQRTTEGRGISHPLSMDVLEAFNVKMGLVVANNDSSTKFVRAPDIIQRTLLLQRFLRSLIQGDDLETLNDRYEKILGSFRLNTQGVYGFLVDTANKKMKSDRSSASVLSEEIDRSVSNRNIANSKGVKYVVRMTTETKNDGIHVFMNIVEDNKAADPKIIEAISFLVNQDRNITQWSIHLIDETFDGALQMQVFKLFADSLPIGTAVMGIMTDSETLKYLFDQFEFKGNYVYTKEKKPRFVSFHGNEIDRYEEINFRATPVVDNAIVISFEAYFKASPIGRLFSFRNRFGEVEIAEEDVAEIEKSIRLNNSKSLPPFQFRVVKKYYPATSKKLTSDEFTIEKIPTENNYLLLSRLDSLKREGVVFDDKEIPVGKIQPEIYKSKKTGKYYLAYPSNQIIKGYEQESIFHRAKDVGIDNLIETLQIEDAQTKEPIFLTRLAQDYFPDEISKMHLRWEDYFLAAVFFGLFDAGLHNYFIGRLGNKNYVLGYDYHLADNPYGVKVPRVSSIQINQILETSFLKFKLDDEYLLKRIEELNLTDEEKLILKNEISKLMKVIKKRYKGDDRSVTNQGGRKPAVQFNLNATVDWIIAEFRDRGRENWPSEAEFVNALGATPPVYGISHRDEIFNALEAKAISDTYPEELKRKILEVIRIWKKNHHLLQGEETVNVDKMIAYLIKYLQENPGAAKFPLIREMAVGAGVAVTTFMSNYPRARRILLEKVEKGEITGLTKEHLLGIIKNSRRISKNKKNAMSIFTLAKEADLAKDIIPENTKEIPIDGKDEGPKSVNIKTMVDWIEKWVEEDRTREVSPAVVAVYLNKEVSSVEEKWAEILREIRTRMEKYSQAGDIRSVVLNDILEANDFNENNSDRAGVVITPTIIKLDNERGINPRFEPGELEGIKAFLEKDDAAIRKAIIDAPRTTGVSYGFKENNEASALVHQDVLVEKDFESLIDQKGNEKKITIYEIGIGRSEFLEAKEIIESLQRAFDNKIPQQEQKQWQIEFIAVDVDQATVSRFARDFKFKTSMNFDLKIVSANTLNDSDLEQLGDLYKADYIFHRNTTYVNRYVSGEYFDIDSRDADGKLYFSNLDSIINAYISIRNVMKYLAGNDTRYIVEPALEHALKVFHLPGATVKTVLDYFPEKNFVDKNSVDNIGTGIYVVADPWAMERAGVASIVTITGSNRSVSSDLNPVFNNFNSEKILDDWRYFLPSNVSSVEIIEQTSKLIFRFLDVDGSLILITDKPGEVVIERDADNPTAIIGVKQGGDWLKDERIFVGISAWLADQGFTHLKIKLVTSINLKFAESMKRLFILKKYTSKRNPSNLIEQNGEKFMTIPLFKQTLVNVYVDDANLFFRFLPDHVVDTHMEGVAFSLSDNEGNSENTITGLKAYRVNKRLERYSTESEDVRPFLEINRGADGQRIIENITLETFDRNLWESVLSELRSRGFVRAQIKITHKNLFEAMLKQWRERKLPYVDPLTLKETTKIIKKGNGLDYLIVDLQHMIFDKPTMFDLAQEKCVIAKDRFQDWYSAGEKTRIFEPLGNDGFSKWPHSITSLDYSAPAYIADFMKFIQMIEEKNGWPTGTIAIFGGIPRAILYGQTELKAKQDIDIIVRDDLPSVSPKEIARELHRALNAKRSTVQDPHLMGLWRNVKIDYIGTYGLKYLKINRRAEFPESYIEPIGSMWMDSSGKLYDPLRALEDLFIKHEYRIWGLKKDYWYDLDHLIAMRAIRMKFEYGLELSHDMKYFVERFYNPTVDLKDENDKEYWRFINVLARVAQYKLSDITSVSKFNRMRIAILSSPLFELEVKKNDIRARLGKFQRKLVFPNNHILTSEEEVRLNIQLEELRKFLRSFVVFHVRRVFNKASSFETARQARQYLREIGFEKNVAQRAGIDLDALLDETLKETGDDDTSLEDLIEDLPEARPASQDDRALITADVVLTNGTTVDISDLYLSFRRLFVLRKEEPDAFYDLVRKAKGQEVNLNKWKTSLAKIGFIDERGEVYEWLKAIIVALVDDNLNFVDPLPYFESRERNKFPKINFGTARETIYLAVKTSINLILLQDEDPDAFNELYEKVQTGHREKMLPEILITKLAQRNLMSKHGIVSLGVKKVILQTVSESEKGFVIEDILKKAPRLLSVPVGESTDRALGKDSRVIEGAEQGTSRIQRQLSSASRSWVYVFNQALGPDPSITFEQFIEGVAYLLKMTDKRANGMIPEALPDLDEYQQLGEIAREIFTAQHAKGRYKSKDLNTYLHALFLRNLNLNQDEAYERFSLFIRGTDKDRLSGLMVVGGLLAMHLDHFGMHYERNPKDSNFKDNGWLLKAIREYIAVYLHARDANASWLDENIFSEVSDGPSLTTITYRQIYNWFLALMANPLLHNYFYKTNLTRDDDLDIVDARRAVKEKFAQPHLQMEKAFEAMTHGVTYVDSQGNSIEYDQEAVLTLVGKIINIYMDIQAIDPEEFNLPMFFHSDIDAFFAILEEFSKANLPPETTFASIALAPEIIKLWGVKAINQFPVPHGFSRKENSVSLYAYELLRHYIGQNVKDKSLMPRLFDKDKVIEIIDRERSLFFNLKPNKVYSIVTTTNEDVPFIEPENSSQQFELLAYKENGLILSDENLKIVSQLFIKLIQDRIVFSPYELLPENVSLRKTSVDEEYTANVTRFSSARKFSNLSFRLIWGTYANVFDLEAWSKIDPDKKILRNLQAHFAGDLKELEKEATPSAGFSTSDRALGVSSDHQNSMGDDEILAQALSRLQKLSPQNQNKIRVYLKRVFSDPVLFGQQKAERKILDFDELRSEIARSDTGVHKSYMAAVVAASVFTFYDSKNNQHYSGLVNQDPKTIAVNALGGLAQLGLIQPSFAKLHDFFTKLFSLSDPNTIKATLVEFFSKTLIEIHQENPKINSFLLFGILSTALLNIESLLSKDERQSQDSTLTVPLNDRSVGGIDLNSSNLNLIEKGQAFRFQIDSNNVPHFRPDQVNRVTPVIINIKPIGSFYQLLGMNEPSEETKLSSVLN